MKKILSLLLASILICGQAWSGGLDSDTKLYLPFDENTLGATTVDGALEVLDSGSGANIITQVGTAAYQTATTKVWNAAVDFDGNSDYLRADGLVADTSNDTAGTISMWVYPDSDTNDFMYLYGFGDANANEYLSAFLYFVNDKLYVRCADAGTMQWSWVSDANFLDPYVATWSLLTVVQDGTSPKIYWNGADITVSDGAFATSTNLTGWRSILTGIDNFTFGAAINNSIIDHFMDGKAADIRYWSDDKSSADVTTLYGGGSGTTASIGDNEVFWIQDQSGDGGSGAYHIPTFVGTAQLDTAVKLSAGGYSSDTSSLLLDGNSDYVTLPDSADWDIDTNYTIAGWVKHTDHAGTETYASQYVDATNFWVIEHIHGTGIQFQVDGGGADITINGGEIADTDWHFVAVCKVGSDVGIYSGTTGNATQVADGDAACTTAFAAVLQHGAENGANFFDGNTAHWAVWNSNYFNAAPSGALTDTITVPTAPYTADAGGWAHIINGVLAANLAKVNGVAKASIAEINQT